MISAAATWANTPPILVTATQLRLAPTTPTAPNTSCGAGTWPARWPTCAARCRSGRIGLC